MAIWIFVSCFLDVFRREDISGGTKAGWILFMLILPLLGCLVYIITRPKVTPTDVRALAMAQAASKVSTTDELQKLADLKQAGVVSAQEYEQLRAKIVASACTFPRDGSRPDAGRLLRVWCSSGRDGGIVVRLVGRFRHRGDWLEARVRLEQAERDGALD